MYSASGWLAAPIILFGAACAVDSSRNAGSGASSSQPTTQHDLRTEISAGRRVYVGNGCALCHGDQGHGDGRNAETLVPAPLDFRDSGAFKQGASLPEIAATIAGGVSAAPATMPSYPHLTRAELHQLASYVISLRGGGAVQPRETSAHDEVDNGSMSGRNVAPDAGMRVEPVLQDFAIGGDFSLIDHYGNVFNSADHRGSVFLLFFGYTTCPDACPLTMSRLSKAHRLLDTDGAAVRVLLISVDPERDHPEAMAAYLDHFSVPSTGLTGKLEQIEGVLARYAASVQPRDHESRHASVGPVLAHTTHVYLIDGEGQVRFLFSDSDPPEFIARGTALLFR